MKKRIILSLLLVSCFGYSEKIRFTNNNEEIEITGNVQIDTQTGDIVVEAVDDFTISVQQPVVLGFYPSTYKTTNNGTITAYWSVDNAESCTASVIEGSASNWNGSKSSSNGSSHSQNNISISTLPATLQLSCSNQLPSSETKSFRITEESVSPGPDPVVNYFRVNGFNNSTTVSAPGNAQVTWSSSNTSSCTASNTGSVTGWSGNLLTTGSANITVSDSTQLTLTCDGIVRNFSITYISNPSCAGIQTPPNLTMLNETYQNLNDGFEFGDTTHTDVVINLNNTDYMAVSGFGTSNTNFRRRIDFVTPTTNYNKPNQSTISISDCPGDFTASAICSKVVSPFTSMRFSTNPADNPSIYCILDPSKRYYMNVINSADPLTTPPSCLDTTDTSCAIFYTETQQ